MRCSYNAITLPAFSGVTSHAAVSLTTLRVDKVDENWRDREGESQELWLAGWIGLLSR